MGVENFTLHDFRHTMKTHLRSRSIGVDRFVSERCLNHKIEGLEGVYDNGDYFEERKEALQLWSDFIDTCEQGKSWNVTPIKKAV
jgi:integrase